MPRSLSCLMHSFYFLLKNKDRDAAMAEQPLTSAHTHAQPPLFPVPSSGNEWKIPSISSSQSKLLWLPHLAHLVLLFSSALLTFPNPAPVQGESDAFPDGALACLSLPLTSRLFSLGEMFGWGLSHAFRAAARLTISISSSMTSSWDFLARQFFQLSSQLLASSEKK